jgi:signal peptidase I
MSDDGGAWRERNGGAWMSGSGARDGGSPPWGPADPVPDLTDTQAMPGLGGMRRPATGPLPKGPGPGAAAFQPRDFGGPGEPDEPETDQEPPAAPRSGPGGKRRRSFWRELPVLIAIALVLALVIKSFVVQAFWIPSGSMENTLQVNDRVLVNKLVYHLRPIHRGDIVVFDGTGSWNFGPPADSNIFSKVASELEGIVGISHDSSIYIKRVIGLPGDHVACCTAGQVTVNGVALSESSYLYPGNKPSDVKFSTTVPPGRLWVMGDHRGVSYDSRGHQGDPGGGTIPESGVVGRAFVIIWPPSRAGILNIPGTFEQPQLNALAASGGAAPVALGFAVAVPLTWLQRLVRVRRRDRRSCLPSLHPPLGGGSGSGGARGGVRCGVTWSLPPIHPDRAPGSPLTRTPWRALGWRPSPALTRPAAAPAPGRSWSRRSCWTRPRSSASTGSPTPSC